MGHNPDQIRTAVRDRYADVVTKSEPCCGPSCCDDSTADRASQGIGYSDEELASLPEDANLGLGCGNPTAIASLTEGQVVLDLGAGAGIDCFLASKQVGPTGRVIGVDMTPQMVEKARANAAAGDYDNVEFRLGEIENLPVADNTVDVIISNCVLNLSPHKGRVLAEAFRVLKPGGRLVISDMVSEHAIPDVVAGSLDAVAACLPTPRSVYMGEFETAGFENVEITQERPYPSSYILSDAGVQDFLEANDDRRGELETFAGSISGAIFEARKG